MADCSINGTRFRSGKYGVSFWATSTEASVTHLFEYSDAAGDNTIGRPFKCFVDYIQLSCASAVGIHIRDGSAGASIAGGLACGTAVFHSQHWDFKDDPVECLRTADNTSVLCADMTGVGPYQGFVKYHFGN